MSGVTYHDSQRSGEQPVVGINPDRTQRDTILFGNDRSDICYNTDIIMPYNTQRNRILRPTDLPAQRAFTIR